jgi:hypothetical protein
VADPSTALLGCGQTDVGCIAVSGIVTTVALPAEEPVAPRLRSSRCAVVHGIPLKIFNVVVQALLAR